MIALVSPKTLGEAVMINTRFDTIPVGAVQIKSFEPTPKNDVQTRVDKPSAIEKWQENLGRIQDENAAAKQAQQNRWAAHKAWKKARAARGKAVREVCRELSSSEDVRVIREYVKTRNACRRARFDGPIDKVVVCISGEKGIDPSAIHRHGLQMVVAEGGIRILRMGFLADSTRRPTWLQRHDTEFFDPDEIREGVREAADAIRRGNDPRTNDNRA